MPARLKLGLLKNRRNQHVNNDWYDAEAKLIQPACAAVYLTDEVQKGDMTIQKPGVLNFVPIGADVVEDTNWQEEALVKANMPRNRVFKLMPPTLQKKSSPGGCRGKVTVSGTHRTCSS